MSIAKDLSSLAIFCNACAAKYPAGPAPTIAILYTGNSNSLRLGVQYKASYLHLAQIQSLRSNVRFSTTLALGVI